MISLALQFVKHVRTVRMAPSLLWVVVLIFQVLPPLIAAEKSNAAPAIRPDRSSSNLTKATFDGASYMKRLGVQIKKHWKPPGENSSSQVTCKWTIYPDGSISNLEVVKHGRNKVEDGAALNAVRAAVPFEKFSKDEEPMQISFEFASAGPPKPLGLTIQQALKKYGTKAEKRLIPIFRNANVVYPPQKIELVYYKDVNSLNLFAANGDDKLHLIKRYVPVSASGALGPKLKEGDLQVPEGSYIVTRFDAMTHLAYWLDYPNKTDRKNAEQDHRTNLGGNIQVHAGTFSTGCIVLSSEDMEELFLLGSKTGLKNIDVLIVPCDLLTKKPDIQFSKQPTWLPLLYKDLRNRLAELPGIN